MKKAVILGLLLTIVGTYFFFKKRLPSTGVVEATSDTIIVGTESNYPPFQFIKNGELTGFEIEMIREIARRLGKTIVFKDMAFDNLLFAAKSGTVQVIAAGLTPTKEREEQILFTKSYMEQTANPLVIVSFANQPFASLDELKGKDVIVNDGYVAETFLSSYKEISLKRLPTPVEAFMAMKNGRAVAYVVFNETVQAVLRNEEPGRFVVHELPLKENNAFGVSKQNGPLRDAIDRVLTEMAQDGSLQKLKDQWQIGQGHK